MQLTAVFAREDLQADQHLNLQVNLPEMHLESMKNQRPDTMLSSEIKV